MEAMCCDISFGDILSIFSAESRSMIEGEAVLNANHVVLCGVTSKTAKKATIVALCLKSSAVRDVPHEISLEISVADNKKTINRGCTCKK